MNIQTEPSIRGYSPPPISSPNASDHKPISPQQQHRISRNNCCFKCQKSGHWARDCPEKSKSPFKPVLAKCDSTVVADGVPQLRCRCGSGICKVLVSRTAGNPNRKFYKCPDIANSCGMFKWCDEVTMDKLNNPRQYRFPECNCGGGKCNLVILQDGPNAGRECFVCSIAKGFGACSFSRLVDYSRDTIINGAVRSEDISSPGNINKYSESDVGDGVNLITKYFKKRDLDSPVNNSPHNTPSPVVISERLKRQKAVDSLPKLHDPLLEDFASNASKFSSLASHADIHSRQNEFLRHLSSTGHTVVEGDLCDRGGVEQTGLLKEIIPLDVRNIIDQLLSMDILDHERMLEMANVAFESLNHSKVHCTTFTKRVTEFISCASSLAAIEWSMHEEPSHQELVDRRDKEKVQFDDISSCEAEAKAALRDSSERVCSLQEEASSLKNKLAEIENELSVREKEAKEHENRVAGISEKVSTSRQNMWEVEEAVRRYEEMGTKRMIAEAALDKARVQLRQC